MIQAPCNRIFFQAVSELDFSFIKVRGFVVSDTFIVSGATHLHSELPNGSCCPEYDNPFGVLIHFTCLEGNLCPAEQT